MEEFSLSLDHTEPRVIIKGMITDSVGPYFVNLSYSTNDLSAHWDFDSIGNRYYGNINRIKNALVIMSNDLGLKDTLVPRISYSGGTIDGEYQTTRIRGEVGRTYYLDVTINGKNYHAESTMQKCPDIDTVVCEFMKGDFGKANGFIPIAFLSEKDKIPSLFLTICGSFVEPSVNNLMIGTYSAVYPSPDISPNQTSVYYMYNQTSTNRFGYDRFMMNEGWFADYYLEFYSLDNQAYYFYKTAFEQLQNDGGNFKVSPYTPLGNFSNGAIGLFQASAYKRYRFTNPYSFLK